MDALAVEFMNSLVDQTFWGVCWGAGFSGAGGGAEGACRDTLRDDRAAARTMVVGRGNYGDDAGNTVS